MNGDHSQGQTHKRLSTQHPSSPKKQALETACMPGCVRLPIPLVSLTNLFTQYEIFDASQPGPYASKTCYGCLQKVISVTFTQGYEDVRLNEGTTLVFALFRPCILTRGDPRLDRLNIHFYEREDENTPHVADITRVYGLVGRIKDGPNSWAIIDRGSRVSRVAYLTHEDAGDKGN